MGFSPPASERVALFQRCGDKGDMSLKRLSRRARFLAGGVLAMGLGARDRGEGGHAPYFAGMSAR